MSHKPEDSFTKDVKGKGKAKAPDGPLEGLNRGETQDGDNKGILSRIAKSAAELPSALLNTSDIPSELSRLATNEKGETSRSREGTTGQVESSTTFGTGVPASSTIRSRQAEDHITREEASFSAFLDGTEVQQSTHPDGRGLWEYPQPAQGPSLQPDSGFRSVAEQEARDGEDVLALLSEALEPEPYLPLDEAVSERDMSALRRALFEDGVNEGNVAVAWDNVLNFVPEHLREVRNPNSKPGHDNTSWQSWVEQWSRVLTSYQDEVWGDLSDLLIEAREEVQRLEQVRPDEKPPQPVALLRLRAILGHLRGSVQRTD
ncbi:hypothetical protein OQA88_11710 [Cercophora sp. LCS_1]